MSPFQERCTVESHCRDREARCGGEAIARVTAIPTPMEIVEWKSETSLIKMAGSMESSLIKHVIYTGSSLIKYV